MLEGGPLDLTEDFLIPSFFGVTFQGVSTTTVLTEALVLLLDLVLVDLVLVFALLLPLLLDFFCEFFLKDAAAGDLSFLDPEFAAVLRRLATIVQSEDNQPFDGQGIYPLFEKQEWSAGHDILLVPMQ